uniref:Uncharacterized protein n=1 Tax=Rhizophora mucronata TaxID=61149 RepID=A0A2P2NCM2_RHIMU
MRTAAATAMIGIMQCKIDGDADYTQGQQNYIRRKSYAFAL